MRDYTKLRSFELSDKMVLVIYGLTASFPKDEQRGLTSQMRCAAVSIASSIVETRERGELHVRTADYAA